MLLGDVVTSFDVKIFGGVRGLNYRWHHHPPASAQLLFVRAVGHSHQQCQHLKRGELKSRWCFVLPKCFGLRVAFVTSWVCHSVAGGVESVVKVPSRLLCAFEVLLWVCAAVCSVAVCGGCEPVLSPHQLVSGVIESLRWAKTSKLISLPSSSIPTRPCPEVLCLLVL